MKDYERIARSNCWDATMKLANAPFFLEGTAGQWYDNNEEGMDSWDMFKEMFSRTFDNSGVLLRRAKDNLQSRAQKSTESCESYIQDVLSLCRQVNPDMSQGEKVAHLMKGVVEDVYQVILIKEIDTVEAFVDWCRKVEACKQRRIGKPRFERLPNVASIEQPNSSSLEDLIRRIVREEIKSALHFESIMPEVNSLKKIIHEEVERNLTPIAEQGPYYREQRRYFEGPAKPTPYYQQQSPTRLTTARRKTDEWRTVDNIPVCFQCGRPGHVARYCRERRGMVDRQPPGRYHPVQNGPRTIYNSNETPGRTSYRSPSPYPEQDLMVPASIFAVQHGKGRIWITNIGTCDRTVPKGMCIGEIQVLEEGQLAVIGDASDTNRQEILGQENSPNIASMISPDLSMLERTRICSILGSFSGLFEFNKFPSNLTSTAKHKINTEDHPPIKRRPYRVSQVERQTIQNEVDKMLKGGIVQLSESPWSSPVVLVKKKNGSWRFCVDYRHLNKITKKDVYPLPRIDDTLDCLRGASYSSSMDLRSGYWQIEVDEADREKTAFITPDGLYEFKVMPFGLCNAPATFERMMDTLLRGLKWSMCLCYLDDIIVFSPTFDEHVRRLELVLRCLSKAGLVLNPDKCLFGTKRLSIFGHLVDGEGVHPDPGKVDAMSKFPTPKSLTDVRSFIGMCSYYRRFIKNFAQKAEPLHRLLRKDTRFEWGPDQRQAYESLKLALASEPVLAHFDEKYATELHTDASGFGIGAVLVQVQGGSEKPIGYASRTLSTAEKIIQQRSGSVLPRFGRSASSVHTYLGARLQLKHQDADCLSRNPIEANNPGESGDDIPTLAALTDIVAEQRKDPVIVRISEECLKNDQNRFKIINGALYKRNFDPVGQPWLLVIPRHLRPDVLRSLHDNPTAGHLGLAKTHDRIRRKYFWPGLLRSIRKYVGHCRECQRRKHAPLRPPGLLQPIPPTSVPFQRVGIDLLGRFPISHLGNKWIIVCTDYLTRYAITRALPSADAQQVAKFVLEDVVLKHGAPREIITDRGRVFQSKLISELTGLCSSAQRFTTAYHPQTNGLTERLNKTLAVMMSMYVDVEQKEWDVILPFITFAYNTAKQDTTGFTPFSLIHGREAETTLDTLFPLLKDEDQEDYNREIVTRAEETRQLARLHTLRAQEGNKRLYDAKHREVSYQPGDKVWIFIPVRKIGISEKLIKRYFGPYRVTRRISDVTYEVESLDTTNRRRLISTLQLVKKLDRYPFRKKRKIDSVEQEEKTMNIKKEATTQVGSFFVQHLPKNPSMFSGEGVEDPRSWLKGYERVAKHNQWDETLCLANVYFYLTGTALKWYENNEESIQTWTEFMSQLENVFGKNESSRLRAEKILKTCAQLKGESTEYYIQDVLRLCKEVDPQMNEEDKISHLMKGIAEELYQALLPRDVHNTEQFVTECRRIESLHCKRVTPTKYERLPNVAFLSDHDDRADLSSMIRQIVREEKTQLVASPFPSGKLEDTSYFGGKAAKFINPPLSTTLELKENYIDIKIEGKMTRALVDSGASYSVISERFRLKLRKIMFAETDVTLRVANGKIVRPKGRCTLKLDLNGLQESFEFVVMEDCSHEVILGWNFLKLSRAIIDSADDTLFLEKCLFEDTPKNSSPLYSELEYRIEPASIQLIAVASRDIPNDAIVVAECRKELLLERELTAPSSVISLTNNRGKLWVVNWSPYPKLIPQGMHVADSAVIEDSQLCTLADCNQVETEAEHSEDPKISEFLIDDSLDESQKEKLRNLLKNYTDIFEFSKRKQFKDVNVKHRINTGDHLPTKQRPYRIAPRERQIIQDEVNKMEKLDIIQPSENPWASPVVLIRKKDGSWRFCVDYRRLNKITKKDVYPLPRIDDTLDCLRGARFYSSMDLQSGYWQIDVEESDREKTAFITPDGLYEFKVMPFGLCNAPATFERMIDNLLKGLKWTICLCYLDDIIVFSDGFEEHLRRLQLVLNCLKKAGLCLNSKKCKFGAKTITVLGHEVSENGIRPDQENIRAVRDFATPRSLKEVRSFLGLSSYYRRFIPNYAHVAQPLNDLLKKDSAFNWNQEEQNAFEALKSALISEPALGHFDYSSPTEIHTDASNYGIGAVLVQIQKGKERAIAYASRTLNKAEKNYSTTERECLAIIWAINKFRPYVFGQPFTIVTDHHSLCWLTNLKDPCGRLARWALRLQEFDVTVVYKSGRKHQDADCLSRSPLEYSEDMEDDIPSIVTLQNFSEEQMNDQAIRKIADKLQSSPNNSFVKIDNMLYRKNYDPMGKPWLLVVPRHLRQELLKNFHDSPTAGHLGFTKTYDRIRKKYYWPGMYRMVRRYVAHCSDCQRRKHQPQLPSGHLQPIPVPEVAFEKVGMDLLGIFPTSEGGNRWIIVCTDYLTKYVITKALPTSESMEVAKFFIEDVILKHGAPRELITDRGRNFTSSMISDLNNQCRITHRKTTAYHPQTNGLTDRLNKTIADMLSMYVDVNHKDWDRILPFVTFAYNTAKQESTGFTPFFLVHGREAETPLDVLFPKLLPEDDDFIQTLGARADEARKLARIHSMRSQGSNEHRYDAHHRNIIYQPGDLVWIFIPVRKVGYSEKLMRRYFGPYKASVQLERVGKLQPADRVATSSSASIQDCRNLRLFVTDKNTGLRFLVDSGADISIIPPKDKNRMPSYDYKLYAANGTEIVTYGTKVSAILTKYPNLCRPPSDFVEAKRSVKHYIPTRGQPIHSKARRLDSQRLTLAKAEFQYMLNNGIIRPSNSPWASPLHLVSKKDESLRPCGDYRRLNAVTLPDCYPIPRLDDFHHILKGTRVYSKIDLCKAFYQIPIAEEDKPKTAIITPFGLFEFNVMSFGLRNATATFQRFMHEVLRNLDFAFVYLDDILVASKTEEEHYSHLETLFSRLNSYGLRINLSKSKFLVQEIDFLGYLITSHGVKTLPTKVKAILEYKKPKTVHELRIFLGMLNFYRTFLNNVAETRAILHEYLRGAKKKDRSEIKWTEEAEVQFEKCKQILANTALLAYPDTELPISLCTDASDRAVGSVLQQLDNNNWKPIAFFSKKINPAPCNYSTYDRELLAIYLSIKFFKHLLEAREFTILTDHKPLIYAFKQKNEKASPIQLRHLQYISQFTTDIKYIKGTDNIVTDALSRVDAMTTIDYEEIAKEQTGDSELQNLISKNTSLKFKQCPLQSGNLLWCDVSTNNIRPFIPIKFRMMVFRNFHELSHPGIKATTKQLTSRFIWPNMNKDIRKWAQACVNCQKCKVSIHTKSEIGKYQEVDERFSVIHIDLIGPLPPSNGNIYCLTCIDRYTSWMEVVPLPDMKSETVARAFYENWIVRFGAPHTVISDQGKQFTSQLFKDLTTLCGIKLRHSTAYYPQCNGKIERLHRTIKTAIRAHNNIKWTETLPTVLLGLRAAINKDNNHSLSQMVYGKTIRLPGEFFDDSKHHLHAEEFVQQLQKQMELLKPLNEKHHSKTKVFVHKDLKTCSHVFIRTDRVKKPLEPPYEGPFPVLDRTDKYFTLKVNGRNVTTSIDRLRPAYLLADSDNVTSEHPTATRPIVSGALPSTSSQQNPDPPDVEKYTEFQGTGSAPDLIRTRSGRIIKKP
ncbi:hypothetical protein LAZ67_14002809, partial [Cordylochernes scorpioides]